MRIRKRKLLHQKSELIYSTTKDKKQSNIREQEFIPTNKKFLNLREDGK